MTIREVTMYEVVCDWPDCGKRTRDHADVYVAWATPDQAVDHWNEEVPVYRQMFANKHYCAAHPVCTWCGNPDDKPGHADRDYQCLPCSNRTEVAS